EALHVEVLVAMIGRAAPALHEAEKGVDHGLPDFIAAEMRAKKPETARRSVRTAKATDHARLAPRPHLRLDAVKAPLGRDEKHVSGVPRAMVEPGASGQREYGADDEKDETQSAQHRFLHWLRSTDRTGQ